MEQAIRLHLLLNHLPIHGLLVATLGLALAIWIGGRRAQVVSLILLLACSASVWPVVSTGKAGYKHVRSLADDAGVDALDEHLERADRAVPAFAALALAALMAIVIPIRRPRTARPLAVAALAVAALCLALAAHAAEAGGQIRHPEIRSPTPPSS